MEHGESCYRRFLAGAPDAFDEIWKEYRYALTFFIHRYVGNLTVAEDLAIDVFVYVLTHPRRYHFRVSLKTYLFMLGRSRALDWLRHRNRFPETDLAEAEGREEGNAPEDAVLADEEKRILNAALSRLPEEMRAAVHLVYFEGLSYEEAARVLKKDKKRIDNLLYRAKGILREQLGKEGYTL